MRIINLLTGQELLYILPYWHSNCNINYFAKNSAHKCQNSKTDAKFTRLQTHNIIGCSNTTPHCPISPPIIHCVVANNKCQSHTINCILTNCTLLLCEWNSCHYYCIVVSFNLESAKKVQNSAELSFWFLTIGSLIKIFTISSSTIDDIFKMSF